MAFRYNLTATARSLLNLEINTIVRDNMTGEPMPPVPHALLDIASDYAIVLCALGVDLPGYFNPEAGDPSQIVPGWLDPPGSVSDDLTVSAETFDRLRWAAKWASAARDVRAARILPSKRILLDRIVNNADAIKEMFKRFDSSMNQFIGKTRAQLANLTIQPGSYVTETNDLIRLQKIWDIGVEEIVAQTIVHVSGDVTTRVQEALRNPGSENLFAIHRQSIDVSINCWKSLLDAVREIAGTAVRVLLGGVSG
jgi:hypothetical protein